MKLTKNKIVWSVFLSTIFINVVGAFLYFIIFNNSGFVQILYLGTKLTMLLFPILLTYLGLKISNFSFKPNIFKSIFLGLGSGLIMSGLIFVVFTLFKSTFFVFSNELITKINNFGITDYYIWVAIFFSLFHSLFEEYFWRWYVVGGLKVKLSPTTAIFLGAAFFAMHHYIILSQFFPLNLTILFGTFVGIGGIIWSWIYKKTDSLLGSWISHLMVDGALFLTGYLLILQ